jgi:hypothetical protein
MRRGSVVDAIVAVLGGAIDRLQLNWEFGIIRREELGEIVTQEALKEAQAGRMVVIDFVDVIFVIGYGHGTFRNVMLHIGWN